jgi:primase-polymerase (primpol)-like protein
MSEMPLTDQLPDELRAHNQWVCWQTDDRDGKQTKVPIDPSTGRYSSTTDPTTWATFEQARDHADQSTTVAGIGFVFTDEDPFVGVDLDDCREDDGTATPWATDIIDRLDSYTEVSPSGTGFHVIVSGELPEGANRRGSIECYETARYFTVTGESLHDPARAVAERTAELAAIHAEYLVTESTQANAAPEQEASTEKSAALDDGQILEKARNAANGPKFERLWNGSTVGYESQSEADMALCFQLAFWTGGDIAQMDRLFRQSGLMREKWDEIHFADGSTYGEKTLERAVARVGEFYEPTATDTSRQSPEESQKGTSQSGVEATRGQTTAQQPKLDEQHEQQLLGLIDRLEARVETLEAENERLRQALSKVHHEREREQRPDRQQGSTSNPSIKESFWERLTSRFGNS